MKIRHGPVAWLIGFWVVAGCASTEVTDRQTYKGDRLARPDNIIIHDFTANPAKVPPDSTFATQVGSAHTPPTAEQLRITALLGQEVAKSLVSKLREAGLPAIRAIGIRQPKINDIVIRGYFVSVDEGSATKRVLVGFGSGGAELMTAVEGLQMTPQGLRFLGSGKVESGAAKMPGVALPAAVMAATANPIGLVVGGAVKVYGETSGSATIEGVSERTADEISTQLIKAAERHGWI